MVTIIIIVLMILAILFGAVGIHYPVGMYPSDEILHHDNGTITHLLIAIFFLLLAILIKLAF